jgi:hypothetical protein
MLNADINIPYTFLAHVVAQKPHLGKTEVWCTANRSNKVG